MSMENTNLKEGQVNLLLDENDYEALKNGRYCLISIIHHISANKRHSPKVGSMLDQHRRGQCRFVFWARYNTQICKAKRQYLLTYKVTIYHRLVLHCSRPTLEHGWRYAD